MTTEWPRYNRAGRFFGDVMPFYEYQCPHCGYDEEVLQKITDKPLKKCPNCGKNGLKKLMSAPVFRLKGSGWYETDFKSDKDKQRNLAGADKEESKSEAKSEAKTETPGAAKPDAKPEAAKGDAAKPEPAKSEAAKPAPEKASSSANKSASRAKAKAKHKPKRKARR
jgi:putative FmdB family regulatory protein